MTHGPGKVFEVYRFQLLPNTKKIQMTLDLDGEVTINSVEELIKKKNSILTDVITKPRFRVTSRHSPVRIRLEAQDGQFSAFRLAVKRRAHLFTEDFRKNDIPNWPNVWIVINNNPNIQKIAIERNVTAFKRTQFVAEILNESLDDYLKKYQLNVYIEKLKEKTEFWKTIKKYSGQITWLRFDLISPNLANISKEADKELRAILNSFKKEANSHQTAFELNSPKDGVLKVEESSRIINSAVNYMSEGGGNARIKVKGLKRKIETTESLREFSIDEVVFEGHPDMVIEQFKGLLDD